MPVGISSRLGRSAAPREPVIEGDAVTVTEDVAPFGLADVPVQAAVAAEARGSDAAGPNALSHVQVAVHTAKNWGGRHENEDRFMNHRDIYEERTLAFHTVGVLDGHDTEAASDMVSRNLPSVVGGRLKAGLPVVQAYTEAMQELEAGLKRTVSTAGTCVLSVTIAGRFLWCSNLGDCRCCCVSLEVPDTAYPEYGGAAAPPPPPSSSSRGVPKVQALHWLSRDHKASDPQEARRIFAAGGHVMDGRVEGLEPSRTLGDFDVKAHTKPGVISIVPEVRRHELGDGSASAQGIVICATDGVWDVMTGQDICNLIRARKELVGLQTAITTTPRPDLRPLNDLAEDLVQFSIAKGSRDDCTAVVAFISVPPESPAA